MKKILLLSAGVVILSLSSLAQNTKEKSKDVQSNKLSKNAKDQKKDSKEPKKDTIDWEKKVIEELMLTDSQKEKLDSLNRDYKEKINKLDLNAGKEEKKKAETVPLINEPDKIKDTEKKDATTINQSNNAINEEGDNQKILELKVEKESAFMKLLTPVQLAKYREMIEKRNKENKTDAALKPIKKDPGSYKVGDSKVREN